MPISRAFTLALAAAALAVTAVAARHRHAAEVPAPAGATQALHGAPAALNAEAVYLPDLFVDEERAAPIEPMPPQF